MVTQMEIENQKKDQQSWLSRQSCMCQFIVVFVPIIALGVATVVLGVLLADEMAKSMFYF